MFTKKGVKLNVNMKKNYKDSLKLYTAKLFMKRREMEVHAINFHYDYVYMRVLVLKGHFIQIKV